MKVRIEYTTTVESDFRMALRHDQGRCGTLATRAEVRDHRHSVGYSEDDDLMFAWQECEACQAVYREDEG